MTPDDVTLVHNAIHNPAEPRHFMRLTPADRPRSASVADVTVASSTEALVVREVGRDIYDHVVYFPRSDVEMAKLIPIDKTTHCALKGDTDYFDIVIDGERTPEAAWSYTTTIDAAEQLRDLIAFDTSRVTVD